MRWFKHMTVARHNPKFRAIEKEFGEPGYARACKLLEIVAERGGTGETFVPRLDLNLPSTNLDWLADELHIKKNVAKTTLAYFAKCELIDPEEFQRNIIYVPQMIEYRDEFTRKRQSASSGVASDSLRTESPQSKKQNQSQIQSKSEVRGRENNAASPDSLNKKYRPCWTLIGSGPFGSIEFQNIWEAKSKRQESTCSLSEAMEQAIQECKSLGIPVPPPFYSAKRGVEEREREARSDGFPTYEIPD